MASEVETILNLFRRDIERHYGGRTVGKTLNESEAAQAITTYIDSVVEQVIGAQIPNFANGAGQKELFIREMQIEELKATQRHRYEQMKGEK